MITHADRRHDVSHKDRMRARRIRQLGRVAGFTPVRNSRIDSQIQALTATLSLDPDTTPIQAQEKARRIVAARLPMPAIGVRSRRWN